MISSITAGARWGQSAKSEYRSIRRRYAPSCSVRAQSSRWTAGPYSSCRPRGSPGPNVACRINASNAALGEASDRRVAQYGGNWERSDLPARVGELPSGQERVDRASLGGRIPLGLARMKLRCGRRGRKGLALLLKASSAADGSGTEIRAINSFTFRRQHASLPRLAALHGIDVNLAILLGDWSHPLFAASSVGSEVIHLECWRLWRPGIR